MKVAHIGLILLPLLYKYNSSNQLADFYTKEELSERINILLNKDKSNIKNKNNEIAIKHEDIIYNSLKNLLESLIDAIKSKEIKAKIINV